jgi:hypothetical protein
MATQRGAAPRVDPTAQRPKLFRGRARTMKSVPDRAPIGTNSLIPERPEGWRFRRSSDFMRLNLAGLPQRNLRPKRLAAPWLERGATALARRSQGQFKGQNLCATAPANEPIVASGILRWAGPRTMVAPLLRLAMSLRGLWGVAKR